MPAQLRKVWFYFYPNATQSLTYVSNWMRLVSTSGSVTAGAAADDAVGAAAEDEDAAAVVERLASAPTASPFSLPLISDLCEPELELGRSESSGFGCINVKGSSATSSLK